jgi:hypothetical protein
VRVLFLVALGTKYWQAKLPWDKISPQRLYYLQIIIQLASSYSPVTHTEAHDKAEQKGRPLSTSGSDSAFQRSTSKVFIYRQIYFNNNVTQLSNSLNTDLKDYNFACFLLRASNLVSHTKERTYSEGTEKDIWI